MNIFKRIKAVLALREAIRQADEKHLDGGGRIYVLGGTDGKLIVTDKKNFRGLKRKGYIDKTATTLDALSECFYFTPFKNGDGYITNEVRNAKAREYMSWVEANHRLKKQLKKISRLNKKP